MSSKPPTEAEARYGTKGVDVTRNGYGIHVGTYLRGGLTDLTVEMARSLRDQLNAVLGDAQVGANRVHFATAEEGKVTARIENGWVEVAADWRRLEIEAVASNKIRVRELPARLQ